MCAFKLAAQQRHLVVPCVRNHVDVLLIPGVILLADARWAGLAGRLGLHPADEILRRRDRRGDRLRQRRARAVEAGVPTAFERAHRQRPRLELLQRSEENTSELQSLMRTSYAVFFL